MERWAANTLRVLGIIVTSLVVLVGGLLLLLLSLCAWGGGFEGGGKDQGAAIGYLMGLVALLAGGIFMIALLGRGIARSTAAGAAPEAGSEASETAEFHFSPAGLRSIQHLIYAVVAAVVFATARTLLNNGLYGGLGLAFRRSIFLPVISLFLYQAPYAALLVALARRPSRRTLSFALVLPAILILESLIAGMALFSHSYRTPLGPLLLLTTLALNGLVLWLAIRAVRQTGVSPDLATLAVGGVAIFVYFLLLGVLVSVLYQFRY